MVRRICFGAALVAAVGCINVSRSGVDESRASAPVSPTEVHVYRASAGDELPAECRPVANLQGSAQEGPWSDQGDIIESMREEAGELGANALYVESIEKPDSTDYTAMSLGAIPSTTKINGQAVWCPQETIDASRNSGA